MSRHLPTDLHIPPTVQGVLAARIDRLAPDEKALLQQLAVIGREFPLSLVRQVVTQPEEELYRLLVLAPAQRVSLRTAGVSRSGIHLQACADAGSGLQLGAARTAQSACMSARRRRSKPVSRSLRRALQRAGASLQSQWQHREGDGVSPACWATGGAAVGQCRSDHSSHRGSGVAQDPAGDA